MGAESVYGGDEEEIDVSQTRKFLSPLADVVQSGIIDIDEIQNHGKTHHLRVLHAPANLGRCQCCRYHKVEAEWHPHRWCKLLPNLMKMFVANSIFQTLIGCTSKRLLRIKGFSEVKVEKIKDAAKKLSVSCCSLMTMYMSYILQPSASGFITAAELKVIRGKCIRISTGSKQLDGILNGYVVGIAKLHVTDLHSGFQTMSICEIYGEFSKCFRHQYFRTSLT